MGQAVPAMMPVRRLLRSNSAKRGWSSSAMNMVGTPCRPVQRSACTVSNTVRASKPSFGYTMALPWVRQARLPSTIPKQWYMGTGIHSLSAGVSCIHSPIKKPLFRMLRCVSVAPLGKPVVPLVNWMLIGSVAFSPCCTSATRASSGSPCSSSVEKRVMPASAAPWPGMSIQ